MADLPPYPDSDGETSVGPGRGSTTSMPRWVKVFGIIGVVLVLLFVIMMLVGGNHGPGRHTGDGGGASSSGIAEHGVQRS